MPNIYCNTILSHFTVITIRSLITPQLLQYDTESVSYFSNCGMTQYRIVLTRMTQYRNVINKE
jgi:hypothetical protein